MAIAISATPTEIVLDFVYTDVRGQTARPRLPIDPATTDATIAAFLTSLDLATNAAIQCKVTTQRAVTGFKTPAVNALERNISEVMEIIMDAINPISPSGRHISQKFGIYAMVSTDENFPDGSLKVGDANIASIMTFLNAHSLYVAQDGS